MVAGVANPAGWRTRWKARWKAERRFRLSVIAGASVLLLLLCLVGLFFYPESPGFREKSLVARAAPSKDRPVEVETRLDENLFEKQDATAKLLVSVTDRAPAADTTQTGLSAVQVYVEAPGFEVRGKQSQAANSGQRFYVCELPKQAQKQAPQQTSKQTEQAQGKPRDVLGPGQSCAAQMELTAAERSGMSAVTVFVDWTEGAAGGAPEGAGEVRQQVWSGAVEPVGPQSRAGAS